MILHQGFNHPLVLQDFATTRVVSNVKPWRNLGIVWLARQGKTWQAGGSWLDMARHGSTWLDGPMEIYFVMCDVFSCFFSIKRLERHPTL